MIPVFPSAYWGSIVYFQTLCQFDEVIIETKEHFIKQTGRNRSDVLGANGILSLSIPVKRKHGGKTIMSEIELSNDENWRARHWRTILSAYQSAPFFDYYGMEVEEIIFSNNTSLLELNKNILHRVISWLDIPTKITYSEKFIEPQPNDFRAYLLNKNYASEPENAPYIQVFPGEKSFKKSLSILDPIMCLGPMARNLIIPKKQ